MFISNKNHKYKAFMNDILYKECKYIIIKKLIN